MIVLSIASIIATGCDDEANQIEDMSSYNNTPMKFPEGPKGTIRLSCTQFPAATIYLNKQKVGTCGNKVKNLHVSVGEYKLAILKEDGEWVYKAKFKMKGDWFSSGSGGEIVVKQDQTTMIDTSFYKRPSEARIARLNKRFIRKDGIVVDNKTGWMWQDNNDAIQLEIFLGQANEYCKDLQLGGYDDWYLPSLKQYRSLHFSEFRPPIPEQFKNFSTSEDYWTSERQASDGFMTVVRVMDGSFGTFISRQDRNNLVRCVRGKRVKSSKNIENPYAIQNHDCKLIYRVFAKQLNIRSNPSIKGKIIGKLDQNTKICVKNLSKEWAQLENGWVSRKHIQLVSKK